MRERLAHWDRPALVLSGSDPIFAPRVAERIAAHIPGAGEPEIVAGELIGRRSAQFVSD